MPRIFYGWIIVAASFSAMIVQGFFFSFGVFYKPLIDDFGWSVAEVALAPSILSVVYLLFVMPVSWMYERVNAKTIIILGGFLMGLGLALSSRVTGLWQLIFFYGVVAGIGRCTLWVPFTATITRWFTRKRGVAIGVALSGGGFGTLVLAPLLGYVIIAYGWRTALLGAGASTLVIVCAAGLMVKDRPEEMGLKPYGENEGDTGELKDRPPDTSGPARNVSVQEALGKREFWLLYSLWIASTVVRTIYGQHIVLFGMRLGIPSVLAAIALGVMGVSSIIGRLAAGLLMDGIGMSRSLVLCYVINVASTVLLLIVTNELSLYLFAMIFGFALGVRITLEVPMTTRFFGLAHLGMILGILETAFGIGGFIGPYLAGYVFDLTGRYLEVFLFCILLSATSLAITMGLARQDSKSNKVDP